MIPRPLLVRFQETLGFDGGFAAGAGSGDGLAVDAVFDVSGVEDAFDAGAGAALSNDVAVGIEVDLPLENLGVGDVADG